MNCLRILTLLTALVVLVTAAGETLGQDAIGTVALTVQLRTADGQPLTDEPVVLQRLPDENAIQPACRTDSMGTCRWQVEHGLYQVLFARPLDGVSALALAEGGLRGFGLTVGDEDIAYHFTLQGNGRVYFDAAPEAARPVPIVPTAGLLMGGIAPTATPEPKETEDAGPVTGPEGVEPGRTAGAPGDTEPFTGRTTWRFILYLTLGLTAGSGLHLYSRRRNRPVGQVAGKEGKDA